MEGVETNALKLITTYNRLMAYLSEAGLLVLRYDFTEHEETSWENLISVISYEERRYNHG